MIYILNVFVFISKKKCETMTQDVGQFVSLHLLTHRKVSTPVPK